MTEQDISPQDIEIIAAIDKVAAVTNPDIKVAVVATMAAIQDMAPLYCELSENIPFPCKLFTNLDEAREWAG